MYYQWWHTHVHTDIIVGKHFTGSYLHCHEEDDESVYHPLLRWPNWLLTQNPLNIDTATQQKIYTVAMHVNIYTNKPTH